NVIAGEFAADLVEKLHAMMKGHPAYDNLPAKQSPWDIGLTAVDSSTPTRRFHSLNGFDKSPLRQCGPRVGIVPPKVWRELESSILGARMRRQISSRLRRDTSRSQSRPVLN